MTKLRVVGAGEAPEESGTAGPRICTLCYSVTTTPCVTNLRASNASACRNLRALDINGETGMPYRQIVLFEDGMPFEVRKVPARPLQQVFVHDPDGVMIELNFWNEADVPEIKQSGSTPISRDDLAARAKQPA